VFVLMLENHSFDNMFALSGIPGIIAATTKNNNSYGGTTYPVQQGAPASMPTDPGHEFLDVVEQLGGVGATYPSGGPYPHIDNSGFAANYATTTSEGPIPASGEIADIMKCFDTPNQLRVLYQLATEFALCDQWFSSIPGPTWPNRFFVHGASSAGLDHSPSTAQIVEWEVPMAGFTYPKGSIFDAMNRAKVEWRLYNDDSGPIAGAIPQVTSLKGITLLTPYALSRLASDLQSPYAAQYTFIEPNYGDVTGGSYKGGSSQHPMDSVVGGEQLIKATYEAIRNSPLWFSSLLIITYDEHGGFYDSCAPGSAPPPSDQSSKEYNEFGFPFDRYGVRVPAVIVSPLIQKGVVDHTLYDHASVPATLERTFGFPALTERDARANDLRHLLSLGSPRTDCPTTLNEPARPATVARTAPAALVQATIAQQPIPESTNLPGFLGIMLKTELELSDGSEAQRKRIVENFKRIKTRGDAQAYIELISAQVNAAKGA
jgi:phospholipase C